MNTSVLRALLWLCLFAGLWSARPADGALYAAGADLSGTFYDPAQNGHGFIVEHIVSNGLPYVLVTWFTYQNGEQRWLVGVGSARANIVRVPLSITRGGDFPPRFAPGTVVTEPWGELTLTMSSRNAGTAAWTTSYAGFSSGSMPIQRLTQPASVYESTSARIAACHAGSWYDPAQSGHGIFTEVVGSGSNRTLVAIWYAYLNGAQRWIIATGPISGDTATLTANITSGGQFPPAFHPAQVALQSWGTLSFRALDADRATWTWNSTLAGFGSGSMNLTRLTGLTGSDCGPKSDADAARFLTQASFGPNSADIASVRALGYPAWIDQQLALAASLHRPTMEAAVAAHVQTNPSGASFYKAFRLERWVDLAVRAPDQLRQRVAFALSQILVLSDVGALEPNPVGVAEYNDILVRNAFGNYRTLLEEVSLSPMMGNYLTHLRNQKTDWELDANGTPVPGLVSPDENYARELMQLFSIGLVERNRDYTPVLVGGQPVPTYDQDVISATARVLTGFTYGCSGNATINGVAINRNCGSCSGSACNFQTQLFFANPPRYMSGITGTGLVHPDHYRPMVCYPRYADSGRSATSANGYAPLPSPHHLKQIVAGVSVPPSAVACHAGTPAGEQQACIDYCTGQLDTLLDTLFMHPNLPPFLARQLIQRLTTSNPTPGYIERVAAVFEDDGVGVRGNLAAVVKAVLLDPEARAPMPHPDFGKLREPLLMLSAIWRAFGAQPGNGGTWNVGTLERAWPQRPLGAPSVFNFYEPDYAQPGEIADAGLHSPEFQILNESSFINLSDELWRRIFAGYSMSSPTSTGFAVPNAAYLPQSALDAIPPAHADLVEALNQKLLYGTMSASLRGKLVNFLDTQMTGAEHRRKVLDLIHLIAISPEFAVQQ
ncbi:MAG: hypothetical protein AMXMBFR25_04170 [Lysobacterales bacterium]|nr:hypothetical protein [Xanthomonadales bacterium]